MINPAGGLGLGAGPYCLGLIGIMVVYLMIWYGGKKGDEDDN